MEPRFTGTTQTVSEVGGEFVQLYKMIFAEKEISGEEYFLNVLKSLIPSGAGSWGVGGTLIWPDRPSQWSGGFYVWLFLSCADPLLLPFCGAKRTLVLRRRSRPLHAARPR